ncbi:MAG: hypothetical protein WAO02_04180 [Verrucomicrobiia bacterium]
MSRIAGSAPDRFAPLPQAGISRAGLLNDGHQPGAWPEINFKPANPGQRRVEWFAIAQQTSGGYDFNASAPLTKTIIESRQP